MRRVQEDAKAALGAQVVKMEDALQRAAERAEVEKDKAVLMAGREDMNEIGRLREELVKTREEKAAMEVRLVRINELDKWTTPLFANAQGGLLGIIDIY